jgi:hypothetical protein
VILLGVQKVELYWVVYASSIFSAEANAILLALKFVASSEKSKRVTNCSDSLSCLLAIESCKTQSPFILKASSKLKVGFGFNHGGFSGLTIGAMSSKFISEFSKCDFTRSPKG